MGPDEASRRSRLVFVDPEDENAPYWWPAIVRGKLGREASLVLTQAHVIDGARGGA